MSKAKGKVPSTAPDKAVAVLAERVKDYPRVAVETDAGGSVTVAYQAPDWSGVRELFGVPNDDVVDGLLGQLVNAKTGKRLQEIEANFAIGALKGIAPKDTTEAMLGAQMVAVHLATMAAAERLGRSDTIPQHETNLNALNKLSRTYAAQVEALKRYRSKGEQRVYVERVNVEAGGQAVVGAVSTGGGGG